MVFERIFYLLIFLMFIPAAIYIPNPGGIGLALPFNLLSGAAAALLAAVCWGTTPLRRVVITPTSRSLLVACLLLTLPILFTRPEWQSMAAWRLAGLLAGVAFYFTWLQVRMTVRQRHSVLYLILLAVVMQALMVLLQLFAPQIAQYWIPMGAKRAFGIFQQPNVLASFVATGLALALTAFLLPGFRLLQPRAEYWRGAALAGVLVLLSAVLVWAQSRTGWLGGMLVLGLFMLCFSRRYPQRSALAATLVIGGVLVALAVMAWGSGVGEALRYENHAGSNHARYTMLRDTLAMIAEKPLTGWGYGGFEYSFQHFRVSQVPPTLVTEIARHPHNEGLLWWAEGGILALLGLLTLIWAGVRLVMRALRRERLADSNQSRSAGEALALCLTLLPITLHSQTEYPFYLSALHWLVFLLLVAMLDRLVSPRGVSRHSLKPWKYPMLILSLVSVFIMSSGFYSGLVLTRAERGGLQNMQEVAALPEWASWMHSDRLQFDKQLAELMVFNYSRDERQLAAYAQWAQGYLNHRIDKNVYANLLLILHQQRQFAQFNQRQREARLLFPNDQRFK